EFAMLGDILVGFTAVPVLRSFHVGEFRNDNSLNRIAFKNLMVPVSYQHFNWMALHRCLDSGPVLFELVPIDGLCSRKYNVSRHGHSPLEGSYLLFVEPRLIGDLDVVSVRVADVCR